MVIFNAINKHVEIISKEKTTKSYLYQPLSKFSLFIFPYLKFENLKKNIEIDVNPTATKSQEI